jgi:phytol kinase
MALNLLLVVNCLRRVCPFESSQSRRSHYRRRAFTKLGKFLIDSVAERSFDPPLAVQIAIVFLWVSIVALIAASFHRWGKVDAEITRKIVHIGTGNVILLAWWLKIPGWVGIVASILFSFIALLSYRFPLLPGINSVGRKSWGTFFYAISIGILIALFWQSHPEYAAIGILVMTWGDGLAALVGQRWGQHRYKLWNMEKSWEGSLAMGVASYAVSAAVLFGVQGVCWQTGLVPLGVAILATSLEAFSKLGIDNLTVPLAGALAGFLLNEGYMSVLLRFWQSAT